MPELAAGRIVATEPSQRTCDIVESRRRQFGLRRQCRPGDVSGHEIRGAILGSSVTDTAGTAFDVVGVPADSNAICGKSDRLLILPVNSLVVRRAPQAALHSLGKQLATRNAFDWLESPDREVTEVA